MKRIEDFINKRRETKHKKFDLTRQIIAFLVIYVVIELLAGYKRSTIEVNWEPYYYFENFAVTLTTAVSIFNYVKDYIDSLENNNPFWKKRLAMDLRIFDCYNLYFDPNTPIRSPDKV